MKNTIPVIKWGINQKKGQMPLFLMQRKNYLLEEEGVLGTTTGAA